MSNQCWHECSKWSICLKTYKETKKKTFKNSLHSPKSLDFGQIKDKCKLKIKATRPCLPINEVRSTALYGLMWKWTFNNTFACFQGIRIQKLTETPSKCHHGLHMSYVVISILDILQFEKLELNGKSIKPLTSDSDILIVQCK